MAESEKNWAKTKAYRDLKKDMLDDLTARGLVSRQYTDKVDEYMDLWCMRQMLTEDVRERGVFVEYVNGANQYGTTDNKSVGMITRVSAQMLSIWAALGFRDSAVNAAKAGAVEDDEL